MICGHLSAITFYIFKKKRKLFKKKIEQAVKMHKNKMQKLYIYDKVQINTTKMDRSPF